MRTIARVTYVKKAQASKNKRVCTRCRTEIVAGMPYKWFALRIGRMSQRKNFCDDCQIRQSDRTTSGNLQTLYMAIENAEDALSASDLVLTLDTGAQILRDCAEGVREAAGMYEESADNMEDGFGHETSMSAEIREKQEELESFADELDSAADDIEGLDDPDEDEESILGDFEGEVDDNDKPIDSEEAEEFVRGVRDERREAIESAINDATCNCPL